MIVRKQRSQWYQNETERLVFFLLTIESFFERFRVQIVIFFSSFFEAAKGLYISCVDRQSFRYQEPLWFATVNLTRTWNFDVHKLGEIDVVQKKCWNAETRVLLQRSFLSVVGFTAYHLACEMLRLYIRHHQKLTFVSLTINPTVFLLAKRIRALYWARKSSVCVVSISFTIVTLCW